MLRVAVAHILNGVDQHVLAELMGTNQGRINEIIRVIEYAIENRRDVYAVTQGRASIVFNGKNHPPTQDNGD